MLFAQTSTSSAFDFSPFSLGFGIIGFAFAIFVLVDVLRHPEAQWQAAGQNRGLWIGLSILGIFCCGLIIGIIYLAAVRPKLESAPSSGYPGGYPNMGGYPPQGGYPQPGGYPPPGGGYPQPGGYPPEGGFPQQGGYPPPPSQGGFPPPPPPPGQQPGWPPADPQAPPPPSWPPPQDPPS